jgi:DNA-binding transcriptional LysR family regulator
VLTRQSEDLSADTFIAVRPEEVPSARIHRFVGPTRTAVEVDDFAFARRVALAGGGVALLPSFFANDDVRAGRLRRVLVTRRLRFPVSLVYPSARQLPRRAAAFRDALLDARSSLGATNEGFEAS